MFALRITDIKSAPAMALDWATVTISLLNTDHEGSLGFEHGGIFAMFEFDDLESVREESHRPGMQHAPTMEDIKSVLECTATIKDDDNVLIHCHAGLCRSTAVAILALVQHGFTPEEAIDEVIRIRPQAWPNKLIIRLGDVALEMDGTLIMHMTQWWDDHVDDVTWE